MGQWIPIQFFQLFFAARAHSDVRSTLRLRAIPHSTFSFDVLKHMRREKEKSELIKYSNDNFVLLNYDYYHHRWDLFVLTCCFVLFYFFLFFWAKVAKQKFIMLHYMYIVKQRRKKVQFFTRDHGQRQPMKVVKNRQTNSSHRKWARERARESIESVMLYDKSLDNKIIFICIEISRKQVLIIN